MKWTNLKGRRIATYHRYAEALKFANSYRKHIRDPQFSPDDLQLSLWLRRGAISITVRINVSHPVPPTDGPKNCGGKSFQPHPEFDQE